MHIYMDNFRGFRDTYLNIEHVNFLVGENSTGKSSVLGLIKLFADSQFWLGQSFDTEEVKFGHFDDIASVYSEDRSYFLVGYCFRYGYGGNKPGTRFTATLLAYKNHDGVPMLSDYFFCDGIYEVHVALGAAGAQSESRYQYNKIAPVQSEQELIAKVFRKWTRTARSKPDTKHYTKTKEKFPYVLSRTAGHAIFEVLWTVDRDLKTRSKGKVDLKYTFGPHLFFDVAWLAPIRTKPRRTYDEFNYNFSPEGEHTPYVVRRILSRKAERAKFLRFAKRVGYSSGLFETLDTKNYGTTSTSPFELDVYLSKKPLSISNVGYGVSQALPIIVEMFSRPEGSCLMIQQPEVHLHPKAQAALGRAVYELSASDSKQFIIETHSDFLIDRYRIAVKKTKRKRIPSAQVVFFERTTRGNKLYSLQIGADGELPAQQPHNYRKFFIREELTLLGLA